MAVGSDDELPAEEDDIVGRPPSMAISALSSPPLVPQVESTAPVESARVFTPLPPSRPATGSRPNSRPGTQSGTRPTTADSAAGSDTRVSSKICCYHCYRQVHATRAVPVEDPALNGIRQFCSDACADQFRQASAARGARERELEDLRAFSKAREAGDDANLSVEEPLAA